ncbi:MAG: cytochrome C oxidase subunit IV family protein [Acidimicrobiales bacterium]
MSPFEKSHSNTNLEPKKRCTCNLPSSAIRTSTSPACTTPRSGWITAVLLGVLTLIEYAVAVTVENPLLLLLPFVLAKGALIMDFFMHVRKLRHGGDH